MRGQYSSKSAAESGGSLYISLPGTPKVPRGTDKAGPLVSWAVGTPYPMARGTGHQGQGWRGDGTCQGERVRLLYVETVP